MVDFRLLIGIGKKKDCRERVTSTAGASRCPPVCKGSCERPQKDNLPEDDEKEFHILKSPNATYEVVSTLGKGVYGKVMKCRHVGSKQLVAVKVFKPTPIFKEAGKREVQFLARLRALRCEHVVRCVEWFEERATGRACIVLELLWRSLADAADALAPRPLPLDDARHVLRQVLLALYQLQGLGIVHADVKPDNIMVADEPSAAGAPLRVKLIDFSCSVSAAEKRWEAARRGQYAQTRHFRAPEVLLRAGLRAPADMWSLGCVGAGMLLARTLYPGDCEYDQLRFICAAQGAPPAAQRLPRDRRYFRDAPTLRLRSPEELWEQTGEWPQLNGRDVLLRSLDELAPRHLHALRRPAPGAPNPGAPAPNPGAPAPAPDPTALRHCVGLLKYMLHLDQERRIRPLEALSHPFFLLPTSAAASAGLPPEDYRGATVQAPAAAAAAATTAAAAPPPVPAAGGANEGGVPSPGSPGIPRRAATTAAVSPALRHPTLTGDEPATPTRPCSIAARPQVDGPRRPDGGLPLPQAASHALRSPPTR